MGRGRGGSLIGGGSIRGITSGRDRGNYSGVGQPAASRKEKAKSGISKALGNSMFTYGEKNSTDEMRATWEKVVQHIGIALGKDIST